MFEFSKTFGKVFLTLVLLLQLNDFVAGLQEQEPLPRFLGSKDVRFAAYLEALNDQENDWSLYISTFNPVSLLQDPVYVVRNFGSSFRNVSGWEMEQMGRAVWPNSPEIIPSDVLGTTAIVWTSGFLVPGKTAGRLDIYDTSKDPPELYANIASGDTSGWSYHRVIFKDMDFDGDLDALTARFNVPLFGDPRTQLLWLENPGLPISQPVESWTQHLLNTRGSDVNFQNFKLTAGGQEYDCILSAEFFNEKVVLYYTLNGDWRDWDSVLNITLDDTLGQPFDVYVDDFNMDGKLDLLATAYNFTFGNVFVWEVPEEFPNGEFTKHVIAEGFVANEIGAGQSMTPGSPKPFYPSKAYAEEIVPNPDRNRKHYILLSGDDDGKHYILTPDSEEPSDWSYTKHILVDTEMTTSGKFAVGDFDGDGFTDLVVAGYTSGKLYAFTYAEEEA